MPVANLTPGWYPGVGSPESSSHEVSYDTRSNSSFGLSGSYIPEYSQTPILEGIARYAQQMAPQVYQWGMDQYNKNQGNIDQMMKNAMSYASPQRVAQEMGMAQAGVMQGAEAGRQNAMRDLQSFGIDPSSGRYAGLDMANRVMTGAAAAGAGNQQRMATQAAGNTMQQQALASSLQNQQIGYGASNAMNQLLGTGMQLKYPPLGQFSTSGSGMGGGMAYSEKTSQSGPAEYGAHPTVFAEGGAVPNEVSPTNGSAVDDVKANLTSGEFIIPKDIVQWKGQEFFYKLMAATRKMRAMSGDNGGGKGQENVATGYAGGGGVNDDDEAYRFQMRPSSPQDLGMAARTEQNAAQWGPEYARRLRNPEKYYEENRLQPNEDGTYSRRGDAGGEAGGGRPGWVDQDTNWVADPNNPGAFTRPELAQERRGAT